jgi:hypothetical protein
MERANRVCVSMERARRREERDGVEFRRFFFHLFNLGTKLPIVFSNFLLFQMKVKEYHSMSQNGESILYP